MAAINPTSAAPASTRSPDRARHLPPDPASIIAMIVSLKVAASSAVLQRIIRAGPAAMAACLDRRVSSRTVCLRSRTIGEQAKWPGRVMDRSHRPVHRAPSLPCARDPYSCLDRAPLMSWPSRLGPPGTGRPAPHSGCSELATIALQQDRICGLEGQGFPDPDDACQGPRAVPQVPPEEGAVVLLRSAPR